MRDLAGSEQFLVASHRLRQDIEAAVARLDPPPIAALARYRIFGALAGRYPRGA
jgi:hypothetical protein